MKHGTHRHEQQPLEQHIVAGVRHRAIDGEFGAQADPHDHETDLVDHAVTENLAKIVFDHGVEDGEEGHHGTDGDQFLGAGEEARQRIDGGLGREDAQEHGAGGGGTRVGIDDPGVEQRKSCLDAERDQDPQRPGRGQIEHSEFLDDQASASLLVQQDTDQQTEAGRDLEAEVSQPRGDGLSIAARPDDESRGHGEHLPGDEQGDQIAGEHRADGTSGVEQCRGQLEAAAMVKRVDDTDGGSDQKQQRKQEREPIDVREDQRLAHQIEGEGRSIGKAQ